MLVFQVRRLIIDDADICSVLEELLTEEAHDVEKAGKGNAALRICDEETPDLIIMDLIMPDKEGIETIIEIRRRLSRVKIIAISAASYNLKVAKLMGADYTVEKPFSLDSLSALVKTAVDSK